MAQSGVRSLQGVTEGRRWYFAGCEYDELSRVLKVDGEVVELTGKPLDLLVHLLEHPKEVIKKDDLMDAVWGDVTVTDESLKQAASRLRKALTGSLENVITTVSGVGYRIAVPVECKKIFPETPDAPEIHLGDPVPRRKHWQFVRPLSGRASDGVWLITHEKTRELHVLKIATHGVRLQALKREITVSRLLQRLLGQREDFVPILEMNLDEAPYFSETEYCGQNLLQWSEGDSEVPGELKTTALPIRIRMILELAKAVAAAHQVGVLHRDLKPSNVLVLRKEDSTLQVRVADFGVASIDEPGRLAGLGITDPGCWDGNGCATGTIMYMAPEVYDGEPTTTMSDVYALGIMLYQMVTGNLRRPISPGWEAEIEDPLLRKDIADAACFDPARRIKTAQALVERLESLDTRRHKLIAAQATEEREKELTRKLAAERTRRPWLIATAVALLMGLVVSGILYRGAVHQRDIAEAINTFLADDLLSRANPYMTGVNNETLVEAIKQSSSQIDIRFAGEPLIAARLHQTIARALDKRMDYPDSDKQYKEAAALYRQMYGALSPDAAIAEMQRVAMHVRDTTPGSQDEAETIYQSQLQTINRISHKPGELPVWVNYAHGLLQLYSGHAQDAVATFKTALSAAQALPHFNEGVILTMEQMVEVSETRIGEGSQAEILIRQMMETVKRLHYTDKPNLPNLGVNLAQTYMSEQKNTEAIEEVNAIYPAMVQQMGESNPLTVTALGVRAQAESNLGEWDDSIRDSLTVNRLADGKDVFMESGSFSDAALSQCRAGHLVEGEQDAERAATVGKALVAKNRGIDGSFKFSMATCLVGLGKFDQADHLLSKIDLPALEQMYSDPDWSVDYELTKAEIAMGRADYQTAGHQIALARPASTKPGGAPYRLAWFKRLTARLVQVDHPSGAAIQ